MIELILTLAIVGFIVFLILNVIPMPDVFKKGILGIVAICVIIYLIRLFGFDIPLPRR